MILLRDYLRDVEIILIIFLRNEINNILNY